MNTKLSPLCVDLDGTLLKTDTLYELVLRVAKKSILSLFVLPFLLLKGKQHVKQFLSARAELNPALLPYNNEFLRYLRQEHARGRRLVLATGCNQRTAQQIADHLNIFEHVVASNEAVNLTGERKAEKLVELYGAKGFDYAGNDAVDVPVWKQADKAVLVNCADSLKQRLEKSVSFERCFDAPSKNAKVFLKAIRIHQWAKNALVFIPALTAQALFVDNNLLVLAIAFVAFGCCASFSYIVNDLLDLEADRKHHTKCHRPFAAGTIPLQHAFFIAVALFASTAWLAWQLKGWFAAMLLVYFVITNLYSFKLKAIPVLDVATLAGLYTLRVLAGSVAVSLEPSFWLIAFSSFLFFSLAIVKRLSELLYLQQNTDEPVKARGYVAADVSTLQSLGAAAAMAAVLVLALYIDSQTVKELYSSPRHLWLLCPVLLLWLGRVWLVTGRGEMHDDPVVFALKDRISWLIFVVGGLVMLSATFF